MMLENRACDPYIGAAKIFEPSQRVVDGELAFQRETQCALAGAAGVDQGAVDVPKQKCFHNKTYSFTGCSTACEPKLFG